jgi:ATP-binding cassette subfamily F protein 3
MLSGSNLLLLDEPTNHLDINSREALEEALQSFDGTLLAVSHDRYFIRKLATRVIEMTGNGLEDYRGEYQYYLEHRRQVVENSEGGAQVLTASKQERLESKEERTKKRRLEKQLAACESAISSTEARLCAIADEMSAESAQSDHVLLTALTAEQSELETNLDKLYSEWAEVSEQLEQMA